jgi:serine/threonine protein kinase
VNEIAEQTKDSSAVNPHPISSQEPPVEKTYVGPFLIVKKLGSRRQKVYHARQTEQNRDVALKFISVPPSVEWSKALDKIDREVNELQKLQHPNLVKVYGAGVDEDRIFFATELIEGESLSAILARRGKLTPDLVVEYGRQIAEVLRYLHSQDLIHSKLTPEKILVTEDHRIKISDLRLNRSKRRRWDSTRRRELDIAAYMAPEQFTEGATQKSDFYSLGVILFEMLSGKLPYAPDTMGRMTKQKMRAPVPSVASHVMNCPIWLDKIVTQMLSPNPRKRPHTARAISLAFDEIKNIAATKKSAASQMVSGFNPLNAGQDKSEARRLLGIKKPKKKKEEVPFFQKVWFQVAALMAIVAMTVFLLIPKSAGQIVAEARAMIESNDSEKWSEARFELQPIMDRGGKYADEAEELYYTSRRQSLVLNAENGMSNRLQNENVQLFGKAVRFQQDGRDAEAREILTQLVVSVDPNGSDRHVYAESKSRLAALVIKEDLPKDVAELSDLIAKARDASTSGQLLEAHDLLARIAYEFTGVEGYEAVVSAASDQLIAIKKRIAGGEDVGLEQDDAADGS